MSNYLLLRLAAVLLLLSGCQSARLASFLPPTTYYSTQTHSVGATDAELVASSAPELVASAEDIRAGLHTQQAPARRLPPIAHHYTKQILTDNAFRQALPDTGLVLNRQLPTLEQRLKADRYTKSVNRLGFIDLLIGLWFISLGFLLGSYAILLVKPGLAFVIISIPLMLFKSKNSTHRLLKEKRKAERRQAKAK